MSAGLFAPLIGAWADTHGRKRLCLVFCVTYTLACLCILVPFFPILLLGRVLGGISTSILFSAFESWLINASSAHALGSGELGTIMGRATLANRLVATGAGVFSNQLVGFTGSFASPFVASGALLLLAWAVIRATWVENYGGNSGSVAEVASDPFQLARLGRALSIVSADPSLLVLGLTQTCFEGSMYLFVSLWVPSLQEHSLMGLHPLGYIFSSFMRTRTSPRRRLPRTGAVRRRGAGRRSRACSPMRSSRARCVRWRVWRSRLALVRRMTARKVLGVLCI
ncbi:hypothetical protein K438DRAFT_534562 [Mycena galopus ATCC 62051]|nr:hypothetical protein K438DRAFT_534562 [Mycena galopus ATCC 62051]